METPREAGGPAAGSAPSYILSDGPLPFGKLMYVQQEYREFACSKSTASWLQEGAMTHIDGKRVTLRVKDVCVGGHNVWMGWLTEEGDE